MAGLINADELLRRFDEQQKAYLETSRLLREVLSQNMTTDFTPANPATSPRATSKRRRRSTLDPETPGIKPDFHHTSFTTGDTDCSDDDDEFYVQDLLPSYSFDYEHLKSHLRTYRFNKEGQILLETLVGEHGKLRSPDLFPIELPSTSHGSHFSVFDVGTDGAPLTRHKVTDKERTIDFAIFQAIQDLNASTTSRSSVGRITIVREPNPVVLGALHMTMNEHLDMDEIFTQLVSSDGSAANIADRALLKDSRQQRSFIFSFDYYTVIGSECTPMAWQLTDAIPKSKEEHIPIARCSSVIALCLTGRVVKTFKNTHRRAKTEEGHIYDPWSAYHVLNIQCYPDHKHSMDSHDSTKNYVNGPEAFLTTLLAELKDSQKRFEEIYNRISKLVIPAPQFMFSRALRDKLLFEDDNFTYSRRYFWAYQTLGTMNNAIKSIIDAYEDTFTDDVWNGTHKSLWPMLDKNCARNNHWRKRMHSLKKDFEKEIKGLGKIWDENDDRRKEIRTLRDQLFSGTSVLESRRSVELSAVTITQGNNIKVLTLVSIFFLPLTFVTSVFGMTNMPQEHQFKAFAIVMAAVCVPFFVLVGSLNTTSGMAFWQARWHKSTSWAKFWSRKSAKPVQEGSTYQSSPATRVRSNSASTTEAITTRKAQTKAVIPSHPQSVVNRSGPSFSLNTSLRSDQKSASPEGNSEQSHKTMHTTALEATEKNAKSPTALKLPFWKKRPFTWSRDDLQDTHPV